MKPPHNCPVQSVSQSRIVNRDARVHIYYDTFISVVTFISVELEDKIVELEDKIRARDDSGARENERAFSCDDNVATGSEARKECKFRPNFPPRCWLMRFHALSTVLLAFPVVFRPRSGPS